MSYSCSIEMIEPRNAAWRWFDVFRTWWPPKALLLLEGWSIVQRRVQERFPFLQRKRQKRRANVQRLCK